MYFFQWMFDAFVVRVGDVFFLNIWLKVVDIHRDLLPISMAFLMEHFLGYDEMWNILWSWF